MDNDESMIDQRASEAASAFASLIRNRRKELKMRQDQLALATGVGRRFLIDLEAGKPSSFSDPVARLRRNCPIFPKKWRSRDDHSTRLL